MKSFDTLQIPDENDIALAKTALEVLAAHPETFTLSLENKTMALPSSVLEILRRSLETVAEGRAVSLVSYETSISIHETSELLHLSSDFVKKLLESGELPFVEDRGARLVLLRDVLAYRKISFEKRHAALAELTQLSQELGLYDELPLHLQAEKTKRPDTF